MTPRCARPLTDGDPARPRQDLCRRFGGRQGLARARLVGELRFWHRRHRTRYRRDCRSTRRHAYGRYRRVLRDLRALDTPRRTG